MNEKDMVDSSHFRVGMFVYTPEDGLNKIVGGYYLDPTYGGLSNFFHFERISGKGGREWHGYGYPMYVPRIVAQTTTFRLPNGEDLEVSTA